MSIHHSFLFKKCTADTMNSIVCVSSNRKKKRKKKRRRRRRKERKEKKSQKVQKVWGEKPKNSHTQLT